MKTFRRIAVTLFAAILFVTFFFAGLSRGVLLEMRPQSQIFFLGFDAGLLFTLILILIYLFVSFFSSFLLGLHEKREQTLRKLLKDQELEILRLHYLLNERK